MSSQIVKNPPSLSRYFRSPIFQDFAWTRASARSRRVCLFLTQRSRIFFVSWLMFLFYAWRSSKMWKILSFLLVGLMFWWKVWNLIGDTVVVIIDFAKVSGSVVELEFSGYWYNSNEMDLRDSWLSWICYITLIGLWIYFFDVTLTLYCTSVHQFESEKRIWYMKLWTLNSTLFNSILLFILFPTMMLPLW